MNYTASTEKISCLNQINIQNKTNEALGEYLKGRVGRVVVTYQDETINCGSCFHYCNKNYLLTAYHIVEPPNGKDIVKIQIFDSMKILFGFATVIAFEKLLDLAVLSVDGKEEPQHFVPFGAPYTHNLECTVTGGYAFGSEELHITVGVVEMIQHGMIVTTNITDRGTSGGPCVSYYGYLIGIIVSNYPEINKSDDDRTRLIPAMLVHFFLRSHNLLPETESNGNLQMAAPMMY